VKCLPINRSAIVYGSLAAWLMLLALPVHGQSGNVPQVGEGRFLLRSGDRFEGRIERLLDSGATLDIRHPLVAEVMAIETAALARFESAGRPVVPLSPLWLVELANGDRLGGKIVDLSAASLDLETESAGRVTIPRAWLRAITRLGVAAPVLDGPGAPSDWQPFNVTALQETDGGGLAIPGGIISRAIPAMPEAFRLDMEIRKIGQPNWSLMFYASGPGHRDVTGYTLRHFTFCLRSPPAFQLLAQQGRIVEMTDTGEGTVSPTMDAHTERFTLLFDRSRRSMRLFRDGKWIGTWERIPELDQVGNYLSFGAFKGPMPMELRDIRMAAMPGMPPDPTVDKEMPAAVDHVWLLDGERISGHVEALAAGTLRVRTVSGDRDVVAEQVLQLTFAASPEPVQEREHAAVLMLQDDSRITLGITGIEDGMVTGQSAVLDGIRVRLAAVREIEWRRDDVDMDAPGAGRLELANGDRVSGTLESWDPVERTMRFRHPRIREPLTVALSGLRAYRAFSRTDGKESAWQVELGAGDEMVRASDVQLDDIRLTIETRYMGRLSAPRDAVSALTNTARDAVLLRGIDRSTWRANNSGLKANFLPDEDGVILPPGGSVSCALPAFPETFRVEIETEFYDEAPVMLFLLANARGTEELNAFRLRLAPRSVSLSRLGPQGAVPVEDPRWVEQWNRGAPPAEGLQRQRYTVLMDQSQRTMRIYANRTLVADWQEIRPLTTPGRFFTILCVAAFPVRPPLRITDVVVAEWDGRLPGVEARDAGTDMDILYLRNGDMTMGRVLSIDFGQIRVATPRLTLDIPVERLTSLQLAGVGGPPINHAIDTALTLVDGSSLLLQSSTMTLDGATMTGTSPYLGFVQIPHEALRSIRWHASGASVAPGARHFTRLEPHAPRDPGPATEAP